MIDQRGSWFTKAEHCDKRGSCVHEGRTVCPKRKLYYWRGITEHIEHRAQAKENSIDCHMTLI